MVLGSVAFRDFCVTLGIFTEQLSVGEQTAVQNRNGLQTALYTIVQTPDFSELYELILLARSLPNTRQ